MGQQNKGINTVKREFGLQQTTQLKNFLHYDSKSVIVFYESF